ncbi:MAG: twin-arginine translocase subunit TatC [SAR324 cluster bacterium]|uniref:Sec-independent protein translocase protein TatC n=1 Tax=SAR324 cluster bacterium TaxID=2024889 RepID=A0A2A4T8S1_9DELT|nr:MAG: twin-arginine translocase subunit TatC [SAR324 cluster bacterium]
MEEQGTSVAPQQGAMSFMGHLEELRIRLLRFVAVLAICVLATYTYRKEILDLIRKPVDGPLKKYTAIAEQQARPTQGKLSILSSYNCSCQPVTPIISQPSPVEEAEGIKQVDKQKQAKVVQSSTEEGQKQGKDWLTKIGDTASDFVVFFQVMMGKDPTPIKGSAIDQSMGSTSQEPQISAGLPESMQLACTCSVKPELLQPQSRGANMVYIGLPELFFAQMKVAIFAGFFLAFPYLLIELWGFVGPALYQSEKKVFWIFSIFSVLFFIGGALFGYFVVFPYGFDFFLSLSQPGEIMPSLSIGEYLNFSLKLLMAFGSIFEMPLVVFILARMGILTPELMIKHARIAVLVVFITSAVLTPPDPFTMMLMAGPLIALYLLSIGVCYVAVNRKKAAMREQGIDPDMDE